jgi:hypothetical protein
LYNLTTVFGFDYNLWFLLNSSVKGHRNLFLALIGFLASTKGVVERVSGRIMAFESGMTGEKPM